jgi:hypothetical protein
MWMGCVCWPVESSLVFVFAPAQLPPPPPPTHTAFPHPTATELARETYGKNLSMGCAVQDLTQHIPNPRAEPQSRTPEQTPPPLTRRGQAHVHADGHPHRTGRPLQGPGVRPQEVAQGQQREQCPAPDAEGQHMGRQPLAVHSTRHGQPDLAGWPRRSWEGVGWSGGGGGGGSERCRSGGVGKECGGGVLLSGVVL